MKSETLLSIRKARKKYFDELKSETKVKILPQLKDDLDQKNQAKEKPFIYKLISGQIKSAIKSQKIFREKIHPIKNISIPNPFRNKFLQVSTFFQSVNRKFEEIQERIFTFLVVLFDAEELLIPQEVYTAGVKMKMKIKRFGPYIKFKSPEILKQQMGKINQGIHDTGSKLRKINIIRVKKSTVQKYPQLISLFLQNTQNKFANQMQSYFEGTGQRE